MTDIFRKRGKRKDTVSAWEKHLSGYHLGQDAASGPNVNWTKNSELWLKTEQLLHNVLGGSIIKGSKVTCLSIMHPVENDFGGSVPACHYIARHLSFCVSRQSKVQNLTKRVRNRPHKPLFHHWTKLFLVLFSTLGLITSNLRVHRRYEMYIATYS